MQTHLYLTFSFCHPLFNHAVHLILSHAATTAALSPHRPVPFSNTTTGLSPRLPNAPQPAFPLERGVLGRVGPHDPLPLSPTPTSLALHRPARKVGAALGGRIRFRGHTIKPVSAAAATASPPPSLPPGCERCPSPRAGSQRLSQSAGCRAGSRFGGCGSRGACRRRRRRPPPPLWPRPVPSLLRRRWWRLGKQWRPTPGLPPASKKQPMAARTCSWAGGIPHVQRWWRDNHAGALVDK